MPSKVYFSRAHFKSKFSFMDRKGRDFGELYVEKVFQEIHDSGQVVAFQPGNGPAGCSGCHKETGQASRQAPLSHLEAEGFSSGPDP